MILRDTAIGDAMWALLFLLAPFFLGWVALRLFILIAGA